MRGRGSQPRQRHQYLLEKSGGCSPPHTSRGDGWLKEGNDRGHHCHVPENRVLSGKMSQALSKGSQSQLLQIGIVDPAVGINK